MIVASLVTLLILLILLALIIIKYERIPITGGKRTNPNSTFVRHTTEEGEYSTLRRDHAGQAAEVFRRLIPEGGSVLDMTANVGGDSINIAKTIPGVSVTSVELDPVNAAALKKNVADAKVGDRVKVVVGDSVEFVKTAIAAHKEYDLVYADPPWGGYSAYDTWVKNPKTMLKLSGRPATEIAAEVLNSNLAPTFVLKMPRMFDVSAFSEEVTRLTTSPVNTWSTMIKKLGKPSYVICVATRILTPLKSVSLR